jgi:ATP-dependent protease ClpP protease subunit
MYHVDKASRSLWLDDELGKESTGRIGNETVTKGLSLLGSGPVTIRLSSVGGDLLEAIKMVENLRRHKGQVTVVCDSLVASAATLFLCEPTWIREGSETCEIMIHQCSTGVVGNQDDMRATADMLSRYDQKIIDLYRKVTTLSESDLLQAMRKETYFSATEAVEFGFLDRVTGIGVDASRTPKLARALAAMKRSGQSPAAASTPVAASAAKRDSVALEKQLRLIKAQRLAKASEDRKRYERKLALARDAIQQGRDPAAALKSVR